MTSYIITCDSCGSANRIPADKEGKKGRCGSCGTPLPPLFYQPQHLTENSFDAFVGGFPGPVLVVFWAPWCPHCRSFLPTVGKIAERLAGKAAVVQVNTEKNPQLAGRFQVSGIPVTLLLKNGRVANRLPGAQSAEQIVNWFLRQQ